MGQGEPVLCIHGLNLDSRMFIYGEMNAKFKNAKMVIIDLPGYGNSESIVNLDIKGICKQIIELLESLNVYEFSICGFCMGGIFALYLTHLYPNRIKKINLLEPMLIYPLWMNLCKTRLFEMSYNFLNKNSLGKFLSYISPLKEFSNIKREEFCDRLWNRKVNSKYINLFSGLDIKDFYDILEEVDIFCNILIAENTYKEIWESTFILESHIAKTQLTVIPNKGHLFFID